MPTYNLYSTNKANTYLLANQASEGDSAIIWLAPTNEEEPRVELRWKEKDGAQYLGVDDNDKTYVAWTTERDNAITLTNKTTPVYEPTLKCWVLRFNKTISLTTVFGCPIEMIQTIIETDKETKTKTTEQTTINHQLDPITGDLFKDKDTITDISVMITGSTTDLSLDPELNIDFCPKEKSITAASLESAILSSTRLPASGQTTTEETTRTSPRNSRPTGIYEAYRDSLTKKRPEKRRRSTVHNQKEFEEPNDKNRMPGQ